jgi:hypothetical protein
MLSLLKDFACNRFTLGVFHALRLVRTELALNKRVPWAENLSNVASSSTVALPRDGSTERGLRWGRFRS